MVIKERGPIERKPRSGGAEELCRFCLCHLVLLYKLTKLGHEVGTHRQALGFLSIKTKIAKNITLGHACHDASRYTSFKRWLSVVCPGPVLICRSGSGSGHISTQAIRLRMYGGGAKGYTDYPTLAQERGEAPVPCVDERW